MNVGQLLAQDGVGSENSDLGPGQTHALEHAGVANLLYCAGGEIFAVENVCNHVALPLTEAVLDCCELE
jgi:nitrite reductase/ring-hydroxylating ferredoxin subunit